MTDVPLARPRRHSGTRPGVPSDWLRVSWLIETSRRVFTHWGSESLRELLAAPGAIVWQQGRALRGALLTDVRRGDVGEARLLVVHDDADLMQFGAEVLPLAERRLAHRGTRWLSFSRPDDWLLELLVPRGYMLKDRVVTYVRRRTDFGARDTPDVVVRRALPEDLPGMLAVDSAAFEPFWRLNRDTMRRALDEDTYVLVARLGEEGERPKAFRSSQAPGGAWPVVGYLVADVWEARAHVVRLGVAPEHQGRGVATRLIAEAFRQMASESTRMASSESTRMASSESTRMASSESTRMASEGTRVAPEGEPPRGTSLPGAEGVHEVTVNTQETNARSRSLYERLGFRVTGGVEEVWARELEPPPDED